MLIVTSKKLTLLPPSPSSSSGFSMIEQPYRFNNIEMLDIILENYKIMNDLKEKVSYAVGMSIAESLKSQQLDQLDIALVTNGIQDVFENKEFNSSNQWVYIKCNSLA